MIVCYRQGRNLRVIDVDTNSHIEAISAVSEYANAKHPRSIKSPFLAVIKGKNQKRKKPAPDWERG
ncbi:hypothetical protein [Aquitalea sp. USM4]|uniref:hypothetical protein n=1 Tax=Aquitalea sp. USM4 TaxID=1590041 RepID=UPI00103D7B4D|nr:hypothetical protein [Aquitalea sp. USM4]